MREEIRRQLENIQPLGIINFKDQEEMDATIAEWNAEHPVAAPSPN